MNTKFNPLRFGFLILVFLLISFSSHGQLIDSLQAFGEEELEDACGITIYNGIIYITLEEAEADVDSVKMFRLSDYEYLGGFGSPNLIQPKAIAIAANTVFVTEETADSVHMFDLSTKNYLGSFGKPHLSEGAGIAIEGGTIYVADQDSVKMFNLTTKMYLGGFSESKLTSAYGLAIANGNIYVAESNEVEVYDLNSKDHKFTFGNGDIGSVSGITIHGGIIFIAQEFGGIVMYDLYDLDNLGTFGETLGEPCGIAGSQGLIFVTDQDESAIVYRLLSYNIPTLSQWGIILLGMILAIFGIIAVRQRKIRLSF